jgi:hypothetical protein
MGIYFCNFCVVAIVFLVNYMEMLYNTLLSYSGREMTHREEIGEVNFKVEKFFRKLKVSLKYKGKVGYTIKNDVEPLLEHLTGIPDLVSGLLHQGNKTRACADTDYGYTFSCELEEPLV